MQERDREKTERELEIEGKVKRILEILHENENDAYGIMTRITFLAELDLKKDYSDYSEVVDDLYHDYLYDSSYSDLLDERLSETVRKALIQREEELQGDNA